jgi:hypothetical protein
MKPLAVLSLTNGTKIEVYEGRIDVIGNIENIVTYSLDRGGTAKYTKVVRKPDGIVIKTR